MISADLHTGNTTRPKVSVIVPVYNRLGLTLEFLRSFQHVTYANYEIILVDDGSTDGTPDVVEQEFPAVLVLRTEGNLWWSKCMNRGLEMARGRGTDYILSINDDVKVDPFFLSALVSFAVSHPRTLVGSIIYEFDHPEKLWYAGGRIGWLRGELLHRRSLSDGTLNWLTGMGTLIPVDAFRHAGEYDEEHFPQYVSDADFSIRARKAGYSLAIEPSSRMWNKTGESTHVALRKKVTWRNFFKPFVSRKSAYKLDMRIWLYRRHWPPPLIPVAFTAYLGRVIRKQLIRVLGVKKA